MLAANLKRLALIVFLIGIIKVEVFATHLRAGEIRVSRIGVGPTYQITVTVFTNIGSTILFGGEYDVLDFGDGTNMLVPETPNTFRPDLGPGIGVASFTVFHTYPTPGAYLISYRENYRNIGVINMDSSVNTPFYIETFIKIDPMLPYVGTPKSLLPPIMVARAGEPYTESLAQVSSADEQLIYQLVKPSAASGLPVQNYRLPENFSIDPISGLVTWDTKFQGNFIEGEFAFAVKTYQLRDGKLVGYMVRDFQIIVTDGQDSGSIINGGDHENGRVYTPENSTIKLRVEATDGTNNLPVDLTIASELEDFPGSFSYTVEDSTNQGAFKVGKISFTNSSNIVRTNPYIITARATFDTPYGKIKKDMVYVVATKDIHYEIPLILDAGDELFPKITVYPNPVQQFLQIENPERRSILVTLFDIEGKAHIKQAIHETDLIDVSELPAGLYVCTLLVNGKMVSKKIVKE